MPNRPEMQRANMPKMQAPQRPREAEYGASPNAAATPMQAPPGEDEASADEERAAQVNQDRIPSRAADPAPAVGGAEGTYSGGGSDPDAPASHDPIEPSASATSRPVIPGRKVRPGKAAKSLKPGKGSKSGRASRSARKQPMIQRIDTPLEFPEFPDPSRIEAEKPVGREDSPQMVRAIAVGMPILGLIGGGAFTFGLAALGSAGQFPFSFAVGLIAVLCMMAGVTVIALNLLRQSQKVGQETDELLSQYFEPETAAVKTVTTLGEAIRREMEKLSGNLDTLTSRISLIEKRLQEQSDELGHAMDRLEQRARATTQSLSDERGRIEDTTRALNDHTQTAAQSLDEQIASARSVMERASGQLGEADASLKDRIAALDQTAQSTAEGADKASVLLEKQAGKVSEISQSALDAAKRTSDRYQNQHRMLNEAIEKLTEEAARMDRVFDTQRQSLRDIAEAAAKQSERIREILDQSVNGLTETLDAAAAQAESVGTAFEDQSRSILAAGENAAGAMKQAAESAQASSQKARQALEEQAEASQRTLQTHLARARETLGGLTEETAGALEKQLDASRQTLDSLLVGLREMVDSRLQEARGLFDTMIADFDKTIEQQISALSEHRDADRRDWDAWRDRIGTALEGVRVQARDSLKMLNETANEVEERLHGLPSRLTDDTEKMRKTMSEQVAAMDTLSASARKSVASIESMLTKLPATMSANSKELTTGLKAQAQEIEKMTQEARAHMDDLTHMFDRLPRRIDGQASHIRSVLDAQMEKIDDLAALAARRAQEIVEIQKSGNAARPSPAGPRAEAAPRFPAAADPKGRKSEGTDADEGGASGISPAPSDAKRSVSDNDREKGNNRDLSVQEILARQQDGKGPSAADEKKGEVGKPDPAPPAEAPRREQAKPGAPEQASFNPPPPHTEQLPPIPAAGKRAGIPPAEPSQAASPTGNTGNHPAPAGDEHRVDHPSDFRRMAQLKEERMARLAANAPKPAEPDVTKSAVPSFLRRGDKPAGTGHAAPPQAGAPGGSGPGAEARKRSLGGGQPERPKPTFRKRFTNFDEPAPEGETSEAKSNPVPDDPVSIRTGATDVHRPHPAAARRAMTGNAPAQNGGAGPDAESTGDNKDRGADLRPQDVKPAPEKAAPERPGTGEIEDAPETGMDMPDDFGPPPLPAALRKSVTGQDESKAEKKAPDADEAAEKPAARSGRLGWSDILAAADRASHEEGVPEAETGLDPESEKARTAVPEGPVLGTPELQNIARDIVSVLQTLSLDLRPVWRETLPPEVIRRFLKGDKRALTRRLPVMGGMEAMTRIRRRYRSETRFRSDVDRFVQEFDILVDQIHGLDAARAEKYMSSQNGRLFILLKQVLSKS